MSTFKQKSLFAALAGLGVLGVVDSAQAVHINQDGLGQALVYPYYTVRSTASGNAYVTLLTVVNTTASAKAVKVRFLEGKNSREVLDFNLFLSQYDVWTAAIVAAGTGAGVFTADKSCTTPSMRTSTESNPVRFRNGAYVGDGGGDGLDRTNEGYFEILEMGSIVSGSALEESVTHEIDTSGPNASEPACDGLPVSDAFPSALAAPSGGLMGTASLINVAEGTDYSYDAVALDGWSLTPNWSGPGSVLPRLSDASPAVSVVIDNSASGGRAVRTSWGSGRDAVSAIMMRSHVYNEYTVEPNIKAATDWVVTMPTKRFYVSSGTGNAARPFQSNFRSTGSCDTINLVYYDREEQSPGDIIDFSPTTPESRSLCWEANVLTFSANGESTTTSNVLRSTNAANIGLNTGWINGWADLSFPLDGTIPTAHNLPAPAGATTIIDINSGSVLSGQTVTYFGLPVVGFAVQSYHNGSLTLANGLVLSNYGGNFSHKYLRDISGGSSAPLTAGRARTN
jgi:hypothetical protein